MNSRPPLKKRRTASSQSNSATGSPKNSKTILYWVGVYGGSGVQIVASLLVGVFGGQYLDEKLATSPVFLLLGVGLGMAAGGYQLFKLASLDPAKKRPKGKS